MILLLKQKNKYNLYLYYLKQKFKIKYYEDDILYILYFKGFFGYLEFNILKYEFLSLLNIKKKIYQIFMELNNGWIGKLFLNGLGFKATKKMLFIKKKYWRFNIGFSHVFRYYPPKKIYFKIKNRFICIFGFNKMQIFDITHQIKKFRKPDIYKGVGIKYPNEIIKLKKGKVRQ